jgi:hypothetical protein
LTAAVRGVGQRPFVTLNTAYRNGSVAVTEYAVTPGVTSPEILNQILVIAHKFLVS